MAPKLRSIHRRPAARRRIRQLLTPVSPYLKLRDVVAKDITAHWAVLEHPGILTNFRWGCKIRLWLILLFLRCAHGFQVTPLELRRAFNFKDGV
jgi:hypothetical protein